MTEPEPFPAPTPTEPGSYRALEHQLALLLRRARAMSKDLAREVHPGMESEAYGLLVRISEGGNVRAADLASYFGIGKATVSRQITLLETLGLVQRAPDPDDGRAAVLSLTPDGQQRLSVVREARRAQYHRRMQDWEPADVQQLARLLERFNTLMQ